MSSLSKHVIHQPRPIRSALIILLAIVITAVFFWLYHLNYNEESISEIKLLKHQTLQLSTDKQSLANKNEQLVKLVQQQKVQLESHQHYVAIQKVTEDQLQLQLVNLQSTIVTLNKELMFYQNVTQGNSDSQLQIRELHLQYDNKNVDFVNYRLVVTQGQRIKKAIAGTVLITFNKNNEQAIVKKHSLNLRHVQVIEGQIKLTEGITPDTILISLKRKNRKTLTQTFDWHIDSN